MKIQTSAHLSHLAFDGQQLGLEDQQTIDLEFSAIDTGGGFKDPILDLSISLDGIEVDNTNPDNITFGLQNPKDKDHRISFSYQGQMAVSNQQLNGRLTEKKLSKELIGFVIQLLR